MVYIGIIEKVIRRCHRSKREHRLVKSNVTRENNLICVKVEASEATVLTEVAKKDTWDGFR